MSMLLGSTVPAPSDVLDATWYTGTVDDAAERVVGRALSGVGGYAVLCNVHVLMAARRDLAVRRAMRQAWMVFPDGAPVAWLQRRSGAPHARRIGGPDLMPAVLDRGRGVGLRHAFVGSTPATLHALEDRVRSRFPGVEVVSAVAPPFGDPAAWSETVLGEVGSRSPHVVWLALGAPKQELWMQRHAETLAPAVTLGVGAAFDFHAGSKLRAPSWMQRAGLEWMHRLASEPRRLTTRYLITNASFVAEVLRHGGAHLSQRRLSGR